MRSVVNDLGTWLKIHISFYLYTVAYILVEAISTCPPPPNDIGIILFQLPVDLYMDSTMVYVRVIHVCMIIYNVLLSLF